jgi:hypothetical protein
MGTDFMDLGGALTKILNEYPTATTQPFTGKALAAFIRRDFPELIRHGSNTRMNMKLLAVPARVAG